MKQLYYPNFTHDQNVHKTRFADKICTMGGYATDQEHKLQLRVKNGQEKASDLCL